MLMDKGILKALWAGMFILCAVLGFFPELEGFNYWMMVAMSALFFLPPALLLWRSWKDKDMAQLRLVRNLALISLVGTVVLLIANFLSVLGGEWLGKILYWALVIFSTPMICSQNWAICLFVWALVLMTAISLEKAVKK